jgi:uncharacterized membrane protein YkoI
MKKIAAFTLVAVLGTAPAIFAAESQAALQKEAKITMSAARATALKSAPGKVKSEEIERENGKLIYSFDITTKKGVTEVNVDAITGKVIDKHHESAAKEAAEKKLEAKEKTAPPKKQ